MSETISVAEYRALLKHQSNTRGNTRVGVFDSTAEARRYDELLLLEQAGTISELAIHPTYELQAAFTAGGKRHAAIRYEGDFSYTEGGRVVVEDVKGHRTEVFKLKEKLFRFRYPAIDFRIIEVGK